MMLAAKTKHIPDDPKEAARQIWQEVTNLQKQAEGHQGLLNATVTTSQMIEMMKPEARAAFVYQLPITYNKDTHVLGFRPGAVDHGALSGLGGDDHTQYLLADGSRALTGDWDIGDGRYIAGDKLRARDGDGLALEDDGGNGMFIADGGNVRIGSGTALQKLHVIGGDINVDSGQGFRINNTATSGQYLRGDGTRFVSSTIQAADLPGSFSGFANPSANVGLSAVNGVATTAMRSDAAPALDQGIVPTWTGTHTFTHATYPLLVTGSGKVGFGIATPDTLLHLWGGTAGVIAAAANSVLTIENNGDAGIQFLGINTAIQFINFGDVDDVDVAYLSYSHTAEKMYLAAGAREVIQLSSSEITFNEGQDDVDVRMESDNADHMFFLEAGEDRVIMARTDGSHDNLPALTGGTVLAVSSTDSTDQPPAISIIGRTDGYCYLYFGDTDSEIVAYIRYDHAGDTMYFATATSERFAIDSDGLKPQASETIHAVAQNAAPSSTSNGALWLDTDAGANGTLMCYSNGAWRTVQAF